MVFSVLASLALLQGMVALAAGFRFLAYVRKELRNRDSAFRPRAAVILPFKGPEEGLEENIRAVLLQDYPEYQVLFVAESRHDPSWRIIEKVIQTGAFPNARILEAGESESSSQKIHNLIHGLRHVDPEVEVLVFLDSDARPGVDWLRSLVASLDAPGVGATTGYRWYLPAPGSFSSLIGSLWNASIVTALGPHRSNFAWGGSMAIRRRVFDQAGIERKWSGTVSDDYVLTDAVKAMGLYVKFVPRCLLPSPGVSGWRELLRFTSRQVIITRVYAPRLWWIGLTTNLLFCTAFATGAGMLILRWSRGESVFWPATVTLLIFLFGAIRSELRLRAVAMILPQSVPVAGRRRMTYHILYPIAHLLFLVNFVGSAYARRITWRGKRYLLQSRTETLILHDRT